MRIAFVLVAALAACATTDPPESEMAAARAETAMQRGHHGHAQILALQAEADARLAYATSENARVQRALQDERNPR
jgi:hypothetical protein